MIDYDEGDWLFKLIFRVDGSCFPRALWFALPSLLIAIFLQAMDDIDPEFRKAGGLLELDESMLWSATAAPTVSLLSFRVGQALGRFWEGTSLLHKMRGEWFDAVSCLMTFARAAKLNKPDDVAEFRHSLIRLTSFMHGSALEEIQASDIDEAFAVIDIGGFHASTLKILQTCKDKYNFNRVEVLLHMIQVLTTDALDRGTLKIAPPILSRVYQSLSRGLVNLLNAKKITDTLFPFPFVQIITALLILATVFTPLMMTAQIENRVLAPILSFIPVFGCFVANFVASELEMPFGDDTNDLPLRHFQEEMNGSLLMLLHDNADYLARTGDNAIKDWNALVAGKNSNTKSIFGRRSNVDPDRMSLSDSEMRDNLSDYDPDVEDGGTGKRVSMTTSVMNMFSLGNNVPKRESSATSATSAETAETPPPENTDPLPARQRSKH
eukprot:TRINITY_DN16343_c0_g2_i1.p1 TRINITY_DN16343_c0_g2~~TRINITY_DN16343_c0_g2_i1.p1  ORF type:complete len:438 (-),score=87.85 TRINITY_DN16343_c0_g2_i1:388-1701(-)